MDYFLILLHLINHFLFLLIIVNLFIANYYYIVEDFKIFTITIAIVEDFTIFAITIAVVITSFESIYFLAFFYIFHIDYFN